MAPEIIEQKEYDRAVDFWALGILLYEMSFGISPFYENNHDKTFKRIIAVDFKFPRLQNKSQKVKDLIQLVS